MTRGKKKVTEKNSSKDTIRNVPVNSTDGKQIDSILNRGSNLHPMDRINSLFKEVKEKHSSIIDSSSEMIAYVLFHKKYESLEFTKIFGEKSSFTREVLDASGHNKIKTSGWFGEVRVHIPELTGMLPYPDFKKILEFENLRDTSPANQEESDKLQKRQSKLKGFLESAAPELLKISLFPRMYYYTQSNSVASKLQFCKIKFSRSLPTRGLGVYLESLEGATE